MRRTTPGLLALTSTAALPHPLEVIEGALAPVVLPERMARLEAVARARVGSVVVVLENLTDPHNAAAILRTADGLGVGEVHLLDLGVRPLMAPTVTRGCERWMDLTLHRGMGTCLDGLRARGFELYIADAKATTPLEVIAGRPRVALAFGNEHLGASADLRAAATGTFSVPMRGMVESFNVSVAAGIALYITTRGRAGDLGETEARALRARFLMESVRNPTALIERYLRDHGGAR